MKKAQLCLFGRLGAYRACTTERNDSRRIDKDDIPHYSNSIYKTIRTILYTGGSCTVRSHLTPPAACHTRLLSPLGLHCAGPLPLELPHDTPPSPAPKVTRFGNPLCAILRDEYTRVTHNGRVYLHLLPQSDLLRTRRRSMASQTAFDVKGKTAIVTGAGSGA
jgi:hypothetical protein